MQLEAFRFIIPVLLIATLFISICYFRNYPPSYRFKQFLISIGIVWSIIAMIAILASYYINQKLVELSKLGLPFMLLLWLDAYNGKLKMKSKNIPKHS